MGEFQLSAFAELGFVLEILPSDVRFTWLYYNQCWINSIEAAEVFLSCFYFKMPMGPKKTKQPKQKATN